MGTTTDIGPVGAAHVPVMWSGVVEWLRPRPGACLVDVTVGAGGHAGALLAAAPDTRLLAIDQDPTALALAQEALAEFGDRVMFRRAQFSTLGTVLAEVGWSRVDAILADLGVSSMQLDRDERGFSFQRSGPLDMRMDPDGPTTAGDVVNEWSEQDLTRLLFEAGEEPQAGWSAGMRAGPVATTGDLASIIGRATGRPRPGHHPATRTFQAIRIAVNRELEVLDAFLDRTDRWLAPGGRLAVLAYHSLEDRRVKTAFRSWAASCHCPPRTPVCGCGWTATVRILTPRPVRATPEEIARNPRARSARLRVVERLQETTS
jgi:16S rRNA (cytosine1402-N4)-methyltransferase